jgi:hypothetical protein
VEKRDHLGFHSRQLTLEEVREQRVVPEPLALRIKRDQEQVRALELLEDLCRPAPVRDGVTQRAAQPIEDRRAEKKRAELGRLAGEQLPRQVVDEVAVVARESVDHAARIRFTAQRERRQVKRGRPPLRPLLQPLDVRRGQSEP